MLVTAVAIGISVLLWLFTGERVWLHRAWQIFKVALFAVVGILLLFAGEHLLREL